MAPQGVAATSPVVLDTNTVLALWLFRDPALPALRAALESGRLHAASRGDALEELRRVLAYPQFRLDAASQHAILDRYRAGCTLIGDAGAEFASLPRCRDADDQKFLEIALASGACCLLSRDKALLRLARHARVRERFAILTPERLEAGLADPSAAQ